jgi:cytochrome P450
MAKVDPEIVTPVVPPAPARRLLAGATLSGLLARMGARLARMAKKPFRLGGRVVAARHAQVRELLTRDQDFAIAPVNAVRIDEVNGGPFILGMDRSPIHGKERDALYHALGAVELERLRDEAEAETIARLAAIPRGHEVDAIGDYARPVAATTAQRLFGISGPNDAMFMEVARSIFAHIFFNPANDPVIRGRAIRAGSYMGKWLAAEIAQRKASGELGGDMMAMLIRRAELDDDGIRRTLGGMLTASIDTTSASVARIVATLGRDRELAARMRRDAADPKRMEGWCNEVLRRWPHNPAVVRKAVRAADLDGRAVRKGDSVIAWTQAAMQDPEAFPEPRRLRPDRDPDAYLHLGYGIHPCAGRAVNSFQIPLLVAGLLRRGPAAVGKIEWAGPFPHRMMVTLD